MNTTSKFAGIQQLGRALMLPIAVLPVAGLLLRLGQPDLLDIAVMAQAGDAIFGNLALLFAIGVAVGFARDNNGTAGLAGAIGYLVLTAVLKVIDAKINMGVLAGITAGISAGLLYNRYKDIALPSYLAFFGGKRFVPIATGFAMLLAGVVLGQVWPPVQHGIDSVGHWLINAGEIGLFIYGVLNRLLIVTGLHHILNSLVWFVFGSFPDPTIAGKVATGDLNRFFAGDPGAGQFMAGFFPVMMFGLPAACLAMYRAALPENKAAVGGILLSMALTAMLTGVTEPVEFAFMFLAPLLYAIHAVLTGLSMALMHALDIRLGFTFSAGLFDYALSAGKGQNPLLMLPVGVAYFAVYYGVFSFFIRKYNLMTLGREPASSAPIAANVGRKGSARATGFIAALGGAGNLKSVDACTTRLRLQVGRNELVDEAALKALGSRGLIRPAPGSVQVVLGPEAEIVADEIRSALASGAVTAEDIDRAQWLAALGGAANVKAVALVAGSRLRVELADASRIDSAQLSALGAAGVMPLPGNLLHLVLGADAPRYAAALQV
ncbi:N-acetylglucosamine-specific PTS transporter subunit IIBC [Vogesella indigofera]|uniref:N-acetylglucosamine-specific PTS transporter subunit IIBC n=1 Tax=Vogesella indigofera TaxID=45465 RepID=UPI00234EEAC5|nr:N-acetylglucosamine-specific PTS transporter subunit IIBC [Vogesella indigofera]MDC7709147.1 N-acetylglucosamine-specific PTS transporter subunit IIBC [Vogesella indigofera]